MTIWKSGDSCGEYPYSGTVGECIDLSGLSIRVPSYISMGTKVTINLSFKGNKLNRMLFLLTVQEVEDYCEKHKLSIYYNNYNGSVFGTSLNVNVEIKCDKGEVPIHIKKLEDLVKRNLDNCEIRV